MASAVCAASAIGWRSPLAEPGQRSLFTQLLARIAPVTLGLLVIAAAATYAIARHYSDFVYDRWLYDSARTLAGQIRFHAQQPALDLPEIALEMFIWDETDRIYFEVTAGKRGHLAGNAHFSPAITVAADTGARYFDTTVAGDRVRAVTIAVAPSIEGNLVQVTVAETLHKRTALAREILIGIVPLQVALLVTGAAAIWLALRGGLRVVSATAAAIRARTPGDMSPVALPDPAPAEMQPLVSAINDLLARVEQGQRAQQRFLANAAHQLRTPVATLQIQIERALREQDDAGRIKALRHVDEAIKRLGHLLHQLLTLAKLEPDGHAAGDVEPCDLVALVKDSVERHVDTALRFGCDLGYAGPDDAVSACAAPMLVHEILVNLLENACQYAPGGHVTVSVADQPPRLIVEDDGPGIPPAEREHVWDRFYRIPGSPGFGCGLGLPIVREMAQRQGASVTIDDAQQHRGTRVVVTFAAARRSETATHDPQAARREPTIELR